MSSEEIRRKFLEFFKSRGHTIVASSSLIPDDQSVLLTTAGMQQFKPYFMGSADPMKDFASKNTASIQKSFRTSDIDEVGDESHLTFFEMLGNFSFGGYFKKEAIQYGHAFITEEMGLKIDQVTVFKGDKEVPADHESEKIWKSLGIKNIKKAGRVDNFWGPTGVEGPCGPTTEIYVKNKEGKSTEIWNIVFNEYYCSPRSSPRLALTPAEWIGEAGRADKKLEKLKTPGVDTGMGLERLAMVSQNVPTIFETDLFAQLMELLPKSMPVRTKRIVADHSRGIAFLVSDGVRPSNKEAGYILRRLMRRVIVHEYLSGGKFAGEIMFKIAELYQNFYQELNKGEILAEFNKENERFQKTLSAGFRGLEKMKKVDAHDAFFLFESFGLPLDIILEFAPQEAIKFTKDEFENELKKHQEISRAGQEKKFGGHGLILDTGELKAGNPEELNMVLRLHTATHLLQQALREILGPEVHQTGSDITPERTRFDFSFSRKLTQEEIKKVEDLVNKKIKEDLPVNFVELSKSEAEKTGALYFFKEKYPERVKVYFVGKDPKSSWSKEFCGGPHVAHTGMIGQFKIAKEEAVGAGIRRIRAALSR